MTARIVSIVSGKGGAGKTLFAAVLGRTLSEESRRVLLIDIDIFVRGLTVLLYRFRRTAVPYDDYTVSDFLGVYADHSQERGPADITKPALIRFGEADVLPAVADVGSPLDYDDRALSDEDFCYEQLKKLVAKFASDYDYIFLDNRAGMDSLIAASCRLSSFVLTIAEDDDVGRQTNTNLANFLRFQKKVGRIYTVINKGRRIRRFQDVERRKDERQEFNILGVIPFDQDVMESFGSKRFWSAINETLYFRSLIEVWNSIPPEISGNEIVVSNYKFPSKIFMLSSQGRLSLIERMLRIYSVLFIFGGLGTWAYAKFLDRALDSYDLIALASVTAGTLMLGFSTGGFGVSRYLSIRDRDDENK